MDESPMNLFPRHIFIRPLEEFASIKRLRAMQRTRTYKRRKAKAEQLDIFFKDREAHRHYFKSVKLKVAQIIRGDNG